MTYTLRIDKLDGSTVEHAVNAEAIRSAIHRFADGGMYDLTEIYESNVESALIFDGDRSLSTEDLDAIRDGFVCLDTYNAHWPNAAGDECRRCGRSL